MPSLSLPPIFVVGHPRSGTTWLTRLLGSHDRLACGSETHLFNLYLKPFLTEREKWLKDWVDQETLDQLLAQLVTGIFQSALTRQGKMRIVEKTPPHRFWIPRIRNFFPEAKFIHVIRDGRDVSLSLLKRRRWSKEKWIPRTLSGCARFWVESIEIARQAEADLGAEYLTQVRYEDLVRDQPGELQRLLCFLGEGISPEQLRQMVSLHPAHARSIEKWRQRLSVYGKWRFRRIAGQALRELGYPER